MKKFDEIICKSFNISLSEVNDSLTPKDIPEWDSMSYLLFIAAVEKQFNISFTMDEVLNAQSLGDIRSALIAKGIVN